MSAEGKILSVLIYKKYCIIKEVSGLAGVSQRATYNCLKKFEEMGVIERSNGDRDRRFHVVSINPEVFCREFCDHIPNGGQELPMAFSESGNC